MLSLNSEDIPLKSLKINGNFCDNLGKVTIIQHYINNYSTSIGCTYIFGLSPKCAIVDIKMKIGERVLNSKLEEKSTAKHAFTNAVASGKKAVLFSDIGNNEYKINIDNIGKNEIVEIEFTYLTELNIENGNYIFSIPTNITPKYINNSKCDSSDSNYIQESTNLCYSPNAEYIFDFNLILKSGTTIKSVESPTNKISLEIKSPNEIIVSSSSIPKLGNFTLKFSTDSETSIHHYYDSSENNQSNFTKYCADQYFDYFSKNVDSSLEEFKEFQSKKFNKHYIFSSVKIPDETILKTPKNYIFLIDRSGSMGGERMIQAINSLVLFLETVENNSYINIVSFGSNYNALFSNSVICSKLNIQKIINIVKKFKADMGGTELFNCIKDVINNKLASFEEFSSEIFINYEKIIILLTDGDISNISQLTKFLKSEVLIQKIRIFTVGIGNSVNCKLVFDIANISNALCVIVNNERNLSDVISNILNIVYKQYYSDIDLINFNENFPNNIYPNQTLSLFNSLTDQEYNEIVTSQFSICGKNPINDTQKVWNLNSNCIKESSNVIKQLYIFFKIKKLTEEYSINSNPELYQEILKLSLDNNILCKYTSFLIIDHNCSYSESVQINVPNLGQTPTGIVDNNCYSDIDALDGGMDMFGGSGGTRIVKYEIKYDTNIVFTDLLNYITNFEVEKVDFNLLKYKNENEFTECAKKCGISNVIYFQLILLKMLSLNNSKECKIFNSFKLLVENDIFFKNNNFENLLKLAYSTHIEYMNDLSTQIKEIKEVIDSDY